LEEREGGGDGGNFLHPPGLMWARPAHAENARAVRLQLSENVNKNQKTFFFHHDAWIFEPFSLI
jgi:hypothetical protein